MELVPCPLVIVPPPLNAHVYDVASPEFTTEYVAEVFPQGVTGPVITVGVTGIFFTKTFTLEVEFPQALLAVNV